MAKFFKSTFISKPKISKYILWVVQYLFMTIFLVVAVLPFIWMFGSAFRPTQQLFTYVSPLSWKTFIPLDVTLENFESLLLSEGSMWPRYIFNSLFVAAAAVVLGVTVNSLAAYGFARFNFVGRNFLFILVLVTIIMPFESIALPLYLLINSIGWVDTYQALIFPTLANGFSIFLLRQFFLSIPKELEEAAIIDGASWLRIFAQIIVPISWPAIISVTLMTFQYSWDAFIWPLIATNSPEVRVIQIGLSNMFGLDQTYWNEVFSAVAIAAIVPLIIFALLQRYYIQGIATTGIKN